MLRLYDLPVSSYCGKVRLVLAHKQIPFTRMSPPDGYGSEAYGKIVPARSVPAIVDNGLVLHDSDAIAEYLNERYPAPAMLPAEINTRALNRACSRFHDTVLEPAVRSFFPLVGVDTSDEQSERVQAATDKLHQQLGRLDSLVTPSPMLAGSTLTLADCCYPTTLHMARDIAACVGQSIVWSQSIAKWLEALEQLDVVAAELNSHREAVANWIESKQTV